MSYLLEIYREEDLDPTLLEFCLYMSFWPTVLQGPICRMSAMLPQFRQDWAVSEDDLQDRSAAGCDRPPDGGSGAWS